MDRRYQFPSSQSAISRMFLGRVLPTIDNETAVQGGTAMTTTRQPSIGSDSDRVRDTAEQVVVCLELTGTEQEALINVLDNYISDLRMEIVDTDYTEFKNTLRQRKAVLAKVLEALRRTGTTQSDTA
jgi:hypothetical protein